MEAIIASDIGKVRDTHEDSYCHRVHTTFGALRLVAVADGMGGHQAGEVASRIATNLLTERFERLLDLAEPEEWLVESIHAANRSIVSSSRKGADFAGMGTTLTAALLVDHRQEPEQLPLSTPGGTGVSCFYGHVGDSRMYVFNRRDGQLQQVTNDHSLVGELLRNGDLTEEEAQRHPQRNFLTQALGSIDTLDVDAGRCTLEEGDTLVLCTDGLSNLVSTDELATELSGAGFDGAADRLVKLALQRGGFDNITVLMVRV